MKKKEIILISIVAVAVIGLSVFYILNSRMNEKSECEIHGGKCYGFGDFVAETCEDHGMTTLSYQCPSTTLNTQCCK